MARRHLGGRLPSPDALLGQKKTSAQAIHERNIRAEQRGAAIKAAARTLIRKEAAAGRGMGMEAAGARLRDISGQLKAAGKYAQKRFTGGLPTEKGRQLYFQVTGKALKVERPIAELALGRYMTGVRKSFPVEPERIGREAARMRLRTPTTSRVSSIATPPGPALRAPRASKKRGIGERVLHPSLGDIKSFFRWTVGR